jgi:hypothetical protein
MLWTAYGPLSVTEAVPTLPSQPPEDCSMLLNE